jgi:tetratricopeptide (TPR) repeat protein
MKPLSPKQIPAIYAEALNLQRARKYEKALGLYSRILAVNPRIAEVHFQLGHIFLQGNRLDRSIEHFRIASQVKPKEAAIWTAYAEAVKTLSDKETAAEFQAAVGAAGLDRRTAVALQDSVALRGHSRASLGPVKAQDFANIRKLLRNNAFELAEASLRAELARHPKVAILHTALSVALAGQKRWAEAEAASKAAIALDPAFGEAYNDYGRLLYDQGRNAEALDQVNKALRFAPGLVPALMNRATMLNAMGHTEQALEDWKRAVALDPKSAVAHYELGRLQHVTLDFVGAVASLNRALSLGLKTPDVYGTYANALLELGRSEEALAAFQEALALDPESAKHHSQVAQLHQTLGEFEAAEESFARAIALAPDRGDFYRIHLSTKKLAPDDPLIADMDRRFNDPGVPEASRAQFGFALSKTMEDLKRHERVFEYLRPANELVRKLNPYDIQTRRDEIARLIDSYRSVDYATLDVESESDYAPVFVTGMPRSGTTLVEQIVATHSQMTGAGEVGWAPREALKLVMRPNGPYRAQADLRPEDYAALAQGYEGYMRGLYPRARRITDKSIQTYAYIGLLKPAMPKARFIVVRRDPRDNLLSIYKNYFPEGTHLYAYDLGDLAEYYKLFCRMIDFWREVAPDWFYEIRYDDLVANPEEEARKLIAACGLEWEDACLSFHENKRRVKTLSLHQVRQPLYASSTRAWERYEDDLKELLDALED